MTIVSDNQDIKVPQWTTRFDLDGRSGEDHLGVEGVAQTAQQYLLYGIITTTDRVRYYSFYAWVLWRFVMDPLSSRRMEDFKGTYFRRHEVAYLLSCYSHHRQATPLRGLIGSGVNSSKVRGFWQGSDPVSLDVGYFGHKLGGFGQYYNTAMAAMEIIVEPTDSILVYRLSDRGRQLALAYDAAVRETAYCQQLVEHSHIDTLSHADAEEYGKVACLCADTLATSPVERDLLRDTFFRYERFNFDDAHVRRRLSLGLILDMVGQSQNVALPGAFRCALYLDQFAIGIPYNPAPALRDWHTRWKLVQARQVYTTALQILWYVFLEHLKARRPEPVRFEDFFTSVVAALPEGLADLSVENYLDQICRDVDLAYPWREASVLFAEACHLESEHDELTRYGQLLEAAPNPGRDIAEALRILFQHFLRFYPMHAERHPLWMDVATRQRLPMFLWFGEIERGVKRDDWTVRDALALLYREYIIGQHEFIALEKLRYQES